MRLSCFVPAFFVLLATCTFGQDSSTVPPPPRPLDGRPVSWKLLAPNILDDQKRIWMSPLKLKHPKNLIITSSVVGVAAALVVLDPKSASYFRGTNRYDGFNGVFNDNATAVGTLLMPASLYVIGLVHKDSKMQHTAMLAGEAVGDAEIVTTIIKRIDERERPSSIPVGGNFSDSWFEHGNTSGSFPSGHTIAAFSVATVIARRYGNHRWVPYAAYGLAGLIGFSRLTRSAHYTADVFMGAAMGYAIGRFTVLQQ